jgi:hypothetical protein
MGGENLSLYAPYNALFCYWSPSRVNTTRTVPHDLGDSALSTRPRPVLDLASTQSRPTAGQQGRKADVAQDSESFHRLVLYVTMVSRDDRPFPGHVATTTSTGIDKTSPQRHPQHPCLLLPYKRAGRGSTGGRRTTNNRQRKTNLLCNLTFPLRPGLGSLSHSLSPLRKHLGARKYNTPSSPLDVGPFFARSRINIRVSSLHHHPD